MGAMSKKDAQKEIGGFWNNILSNKSIDAKPYDLSKFIVLDEPSASDLLATLQENDRASKTNTSAWQKYFSVLNEGETWQIKFVQNNDLQKASIDDLVEASRVARESAISYNAALKQQTLGAKSAAIAAKGLALAGNMLAMWAISQAISLTIQGIDSLVNRTDKLKEKVTQSRETFEKTKSELDTLNSSLKTTQTRIDELSAKQNLTLVESEELEKLKAQNNELERELKIKEALAKKEGKKANDDAVAYFHAKTNKVKYAVDDTSGKMYLADGTNYSLIDDIENKLSLIPIMEKKKSELQEQIEQLASANPNYSSTIEFLDLQGNFNRLDTELETFREDIDNSISDFMEMDDSLISGYDDGLLSRLDSLYAKYDELISGTAQSHANIIEGAFGKIDFKSCKDQLVKLGQTGQLSLQILNSKFPALISYLQTAGIETEELYQYLMALANPDALKYDELGAQLDKLLLRELTQTENLNPFTMGIQFSLLKDELQKSNLYDENSLEAFATIKARYTNGETAFWTLEDWISNIQDELSSMNNSSDHSLSISSTIDKINTQFKPAIDSLKSAYQDILTADSMNLKTIDFSYLTAIKSELDKMKDAGLTIDYSSYDDFVQVLLNSKATTYQVNQAFANLANSITYAAITGAEDFETLKYALDNLEIKNSEIVAFQALSSNTEALKESGLDLVNATYSQIEAFAQEKLSAETASQGIAVLLYQQMLISGNPLNTISSIQSLENLGGKSAETAGTLAELAQIMARINSVQTYISNNPNSDLSLVEATLGGLQKRAEALQSKIFTDVDFSNIVNNKTMDKASNAAQTQLDTFSDLTSELNSLKSGYDAVKDAAETYSEYGRITVDQAEQLIDTDLRLLAAMDSEENAYYSLANAKLEEMKIQMARNALNTLNSLQTEADAVEYLAMANVNLRNQTLSANEALLQQAVMQKQNMGGAMADAADTIWQGYQNAVSMLGKVDVSFDLSAAKQTSESQTQTEAAKETDLADRFDEQKKVLDHLLAMDEINKSEYYERLMNLADKLFAGNDKYKENLWDVQEQYHDYIESVKKTYNWIENLLESLSAKTNAFIDKAEKFISWQKKNFTINRAVKAADNEIAKNQSVYETYMKKANSAGLSNSYIRKIQNGTLKIEEISDEELSEKIEKYTEWFDKAQDILETIDDLYDRERDLIRQKLDNVLDYYDDLDSYLSSVTSKMESLISFHDSMGKRSSLTELVKQFAQADVRLSSAVSLTPETARTEADFGESEAVNAARKADNQKIIDSIQAQIDNLNVTQSGTYTKLLKNIAKTEAQIQKYRDKGWDSEKAKQYEKLTAKLEDYYELRAELDANATSDTIAGYSKIYTAYQQLQNKIDSGKTLTKSQQKKYDSYLLQLERLRNQKDAVLSELETRLGLANGTIAPAAEEETIRQKINALQSDLENTATYQNLIRSITAAESDLAALEEKGYDNLTSKQKKTYDKLTKQLEAYYEKKQAFDANATAANIAEYDKIYSSWKALQDKLDAGGNLTPDQWKNYNKYTKQLESFAVSKEETLADLQARLDKITNPGDKLDIIDREYEEAAEGIYDSYQNQIDGVKNAVTETAQYQKLLANAQKLEQKKDTKGLTAGEQAKLDKYHAELEALRMGGTAGNISDYMKTWEKWYALEQKLQKNGKLSESDAVKYDTYKAQLNAWNEEKQSQINDLISQMEDDLEALQKTYTENVSEAESEINDYYANLYDLAKQIAEYNLTTLKTQLSFLEAYINYYQELVSLYDSFSGDKLAKLLTDLDIGLMESQDRLYQQYLEKLQEKYNTTLSKINEYNELIRAIDTNDFAGSMELFQKAIAEYQANGQTEMAAKLQSVLDLLDERAADSDHWDAFADEWLMEWEEALAEAKTELISTAASIQEVNDALREINVSNITNAIQELSDAQEILSSVTGLIHDDWLYDEDGNLTQYGITKVGLLAEQIERAKQEVSKYAELIESVNSMKDTYASESAYKEALQEAKMNYLSSLSTLQGYQDSVVSILTKADEEVINSLQDVINKRKEALQKKKELYDYNKTIQSSQKEIDSIQAQIDALESLSGAEDAAAKAKLAQLKADLNDKQQALQDTKDEHTYNLQIDALDEFMNTLSSTMTEAAESVNKSFETYVQALQEAAKIHEQTKNELPGQTSSLLSSIINLSAFSASIPPEALESESIKYTLTNTDTDLSLPGDGQSTALTADCSKLLEAINSLQSSIPPLPIPTLPSVPNLIMERSTPPVVNVHYDNLLNIENNGSIDEAFVNGKMPEIIRKSFEYTAKELYSQSLRLR